MKSGSLISARLANEQGREVFAIPGSIHNPLSKGCHNLIRNGAKLVDKVEDILEELKLNIEIETADTFKTITVSNDELEVIDPQHQKILSCMEFEPISTDEIVERSGLAVEVVSSILLILELNNKVLHQGNGIYVRCGTHQKLAAAH